VVGLAMACLSPSSLFCTPLLLQQLNDMRGLQRPRRWRAPAWEGIQWIRRWRPHGRMKQRRRAPTPSPACQAQPPPCHLWWCAPPLLLWIPVDRPSLLRVGQSVLLPAHASRHASGAPPMPHVGLAAPLPRIGGQLSNRGRSMGRLSRYVRNEHLDFGALRPCSPALHSGGPAVGAKIPTSSTAGRNRGRT
jgi:hypothetical protein